jgi:hypothetical protein
MSPYFTDADALFRMILSWGALLSDRGSTIPDVDMFIAGPVDSDTMAAENPEHRNGIVNFANKDYKSQTSGTILPFAKIVADSAQGYGPEVIDVYHDVRIGAPDQTIGTSGSTHLVLMNTMNMNFGLIVPTPTPTKTILSLDWLTPIPLSLFTEDLQLVQLLRTNNSSLEITLVPLPTCLDSITTILTMTFQIMLQHGTYSIWHAENSTPTVIWEVSIPTSFSNSEPFLQKSNTPMMTMKIRSHPQRQFLAVIQFLMESLETWPTVLILLLILRLQEEETKHFEM